MFCLENVYTYVFHPGMAIQTKSLKVKRSSHKGYEHLVWNFFPLSYVYGESWYEGSAFKLLRYTSAADVKRNVV